MSTQGPSEAVACSCPSCRAVSAASSSRVSGRPSTSSAFFSVTLKALVASRTLLENFVLSSASRWLISLYRSRSSSSRPTPFSSASRMADSIIRFWAGAKPRASSLSRKARQAWYRGLLWPSRLLNLTTSASRGSYTSLNSGEFFTPCKWDTMPQVRLRSSSIFSSGSISSRQVRGAVSSSRATASSQPSSRARIPGSICRVSIRSKGGRSSQFSSGLFSILIALPFCCVRLSWGTISAGLQAREP